MNKIYSLLLFILCLSASARGQYIDLSAPFLPPSFDVGYLSVPSADVIWATGYGSPASQGFVRSADGGQTWNSGNIPTPTEMWDNTSIIALDANTAWVTFIDRTNSTLGAIYKTSDGGINWVRQGTDSLFLDVDLSFANSTYFWDENIGITMGDPVGGYFEFWRTTDGGSTWSRVPQGNLPPPVDSGDYGYSDAYDVAGDTIWNTSRRGTCLRSTDRGQTWQGFATGHTGYYRVYFQDAAHGLSLRASSSSAPNDFRATTDGGATWSAAFTATVSDSSLALVDAPFFVRRLDYVPGTSILVGVGRETNSLLELAAVSYDGGHTFTSLGAAPGDFSLVKMLSPTSGYLGGWLQDTAKIYRLDAALSAIREPLATNAPIKILGNPATKQLTMEVLEDLGSKTVFTLFSLDGRQVRTMTASFAVAGQKLQMPIGNLSAGFYLLKVNTNRGVSTMKVMVK